uniref:Uncharacterized protein n=1 Tax=Amphimedon queenslandica TaxID=400682 RepID=A0A1X7SE35_AMPQE
MDLSTAQFSLDSVKFVRTQETNKTHLFVRSQSHKSRLYYGYQDWGSGEWSEVKPIGDSDLYLYFDFDVVVNTFVSRVEVYIVAQDYHMRHIWQN